MNANRGDHEALEAATGLHRAGRLAEAEALYRTVLRSRRHDFAVLHRLGICLHQAGKIEEATRVLGQAVKANPTEPLVHLSLAEAQRAARRHAEALAGYHRAALLAPQDPMPHLARAAALEELQRHEDALASYRQAGRLDAGNLDARVGQGNCCLMLGRREEAIVHFDAVLARQSDHALAACNRAVVLTQLGRLDEALQVFDALLAQRPQDAAVISNRGNALFGLDRFEEALQCQEAALRLQPNLLSAQISLSATLIMLNRLEEALAALDKVIAVHQQHADARRDRAMVLLTLGRFEDALPEFEWREAGMRRVENAVAGSRGGAPRRWLGPSSALGELKGRSILLYNEQGHGDTLQFVRYVAPLAAAGAQVMLRVQAGLAPLLQRLPGVAAVVVDGSVTPRTDYMTPLMSLPYALRTDLTAIPADLPYVHALPERVEEWRAKLRSDGRPCVGVAWSGSAGHTNDRRRSIALVRWESLLGRDARFLALQPDVRPADAPVLRELPGLAFPGTAIADFEDSAALISLCDLVICVDTAVAHLAGAMNKPVWVLVPHAPDWRWMMDRHDSPWYPSMRLFRQGSSGDWDSVLATVAEALDARLALAQSAPVLGTGAFAPVPA